MTKNKILTVLAAWGLCIMMPVSILMCETGRYAAPHPLICGRMPDDKNREDYKHG